MSIHPPVSVYVINLDERSDRWERIKKQCLSCGITPIRVSAVKASPGWHGCAMSHKKVCELAESKGEPWYLVLEDDALLTNDDWKRFVNLLPRLWEIRDTWQVFNGGMGQVADIQIIDRNPPLFKAQGILTHFLLVNSSGYDIFKNWTPEMYHVDQYLKSNSKMIGTYPFISNQEESPSDIGIGNPQGDYNHGLNVVREKLLSEKVIEQYLNLVTSKPYTTRQSTLLERVAHYFNF
jgi:hypothetical protein